MSNPVPNDDVVSHGGVTLDCRQRLALVGDQVIPLTSSECRILETLIRRPGQTFTRADLLRVARGDDTTSSRRTVDVHIRALRRKLGEAGPLITAIRGAGYCFDATGFS